jgi:amino acid adenylation domain-containing protein
MSDGRSNSPTRQELRAARRELVATILEKEGIDLQSGQKIFPSQCRDNLPLSFAQERLWFLDQLEPGNSVYNICRAHRLTGSLDITVLTLSLNEVVRRHEVLRTTFPAVDGRPIQVVTAALTLTVKVIDLREVTQTNRETELLRAAIEEGRQSFDLALGPLLKVALLRISEEDHLLVFTVHQIICDGWSAGIFFRELEKIYETFFNGQSLTLPPLPVQYADFVLFQHQWLKGEVLEAQLFYWKNRLGAIIPMLELPTDRPRSSVQTFRGAREAIELPTSITAPLKELSRQEGATLFVILMAAFNTLLHRYTTQEDIIIGFPIASRNHAEIQNAIGFFVNTLPLRTDLSRNPTFRELLSRVRTVCIEAYAHQDLPFEKLVEELHQERDLSRNPLFQVMFVFQNISDPVLKFPDVKSAPIGIDTGTSKFDLTLSLAEREQTLVGFIEYSTDLFERSTVERMIGHFQTLLEGIVVDPDRPISTLPLLTDAERHQLLVDWNSTRADFPEGCCLHELFEAQVERTPDAVAAVFENQWLTYGQLNARANQLAHYLKQRGVGPEKLVGISSERSLEMVVGVMGILKAGGAYVPIDPTYPKERVAFLIKDTQVSVLLLQERLKVDLPDYDGDVVCLDSDWEVIAKNDEQNPVHNVTVENSAYVIFTSGSTGEPKGAMNTHRGICNRLLWMQDAFRLTEFDRVLQKTPFSFDVSVWEIFWPLLNGARLVIARPGGHQDNIYLANLISSQRITVLHFVPSMLQVFLEQASLEGCGCLRIVICSGEALLFELQERFFARLGAELHNLYGPTEAAIDVTRWACERGSNRRTIPIGRPIANTQIYILDSNMQPVPIGVPGELHIGGYGLARGYLNRPELTAENFVACPFSSEPGARLYRTGDVARYLRDGNIEFLGRVDNQVKIRGHRIELGEIEATLIQNPAVSQTVVVAFDKPASDSDNLKSKTRTELSRSIKNSKSLVAYIVPVAVSPSVTELHNFLKKKLPDYMIPSWFVFLDALPLTPNGKIDRNALPPPDGERPLLDQGFVEPRAEIEELVAQVWRDILKVEQVGVYDNFFELGGHSLLATRVVSRLRQNFDIDLPLRKLFELPSVAALAEHIAIVLQDKSRNKTPPIVPVSRDRLIPLSFSQQRLWFLHQVDPAMTAYNIPAIFHIEGPFNVGALEETLNATVARHEILRTNFAVVDGSPVQRILPSMKMLVSIADLSDIPNGVSEARVRQLALEEARQPFDLAGDPLVRARLLRVNEQDHFLILNVHHAVLDGWSMGTLFQELGNLYEVFSEGQPVPLSPLPVQFADYAVWQRETIQGDVLAAQLDYWKRQLGDHLPALNVPADYARPATQSFRGARQAMLLSEELTQALKELSRREGVTVFMTLLAAFNILLSRHSGQDDVIIGSTIAGRNRPEIEGLIGFFINALVLRIDLSGEPSFLELLKRVREVCLGAYTHQDLPFEKIVEAINPERDLSRNPLFQIMFNMADVSERMLQLRGCEVSRASFFDPQAKFDITLYAPEKEGRIELAIVYNTDLFSESRIAVILEQLRYLLSQIAERPEDRRATFDFVPPTTRALLPDPNEDLNDSWEGAIHTVFSQQAERVPDQLATVDPNEAWTYGELDARTNQIAHYISESGIKPKDVVAIYAHRSSELVLALLGILKAGAVFVILDPAYPSSRLISYLRIGKPRGWLQMQGAGKLPDELQAYLDRLALACRLELPVRKEALSELLLANSQADLGIAVEANEPAYIAFTSGSTGEPKGVLSRHGPITHFLPWQKEAFDLGESDRFSMLSGLAYSHLHRDVFTPLALGATLYVPPGEVARDPEQLTEWLRANSISVLHLTPALGQLLLTAGTQPLPAVRRILFGGDVLTTGQVAQTRAIAPNATIGSFYGATETQRAVGYYEIPNDFTSNNVDANQPMPLGRGIKDVQLLLLNSFGHLAGVGELAELYVRSPHLAEGYIEDERLTEEKFLTNPFTSDPNDRLYRTGELGRYLPDGNVAWAGRNDRRVNIRGFRVELAEVEAVLNQHPIIRESVVVARSENQVRPENLKSKIENQEFNLCLVAYVVAEEEGESLIDLLRSFLGARLPDYMVPGYFVILDRLPLSPNSKVDYQALPPVEQSLTRFTDSFVAARDDIEAKLCEIFSQVLGIEQVGVNDNFFRLGGHSLLAARAAAYIKEAFGVGVELRVFLESPTVTTLARQVELLSSAGQPTVQSAKDEREEIEI